MTYTITRYGNRKMYLKTFAKQFQKVEGRYITFDDLNKMKEHQWVVIDHKTGNDITARIKIELDYRNALSKLEVEESTGGHDNGNLRVLLQEQNGYNEHS